MNRGSTARRVMGPAVLGVLAFAVAATAGETSLEVRLEPRRFGVEDVVRLEVRIAEPPDNPNPPELGALKNLEIVAGPSVGSEFSWINGVRSRAITYTYVLRALAVGPAAVGPVEFSHGDEVLTAEPITAEVVPGSVAQTRSVARSSPFSRDPFEDFFGGRTQTQSARVELRLLVSSRQVVLGEPVVATIVLDTTTSGVDGFEWTTPPTFPGWWAQQVEPPEPAPREVVKVDGIGFNRFVVQRYVLVPLKTGELALPDVGARIGFRTRSFFAPQQVVERATGESVVEVLPRPRPPAGFSGAVGALKYRASLEPKAIAFGEPTVLTIELSGSGNLPLVEAPSQWPSCADCESYPPEEESRFHADESGIHGSRVWSTTLVPRTWGELSLDPVTLSVFDPQVGRYRTQTVGPLRVVVGPPPPTPTPEVAQEVETAPRTNEPAETAGEYSGPRAIPSWAWIVGALLVGVLVGGGATVAMSRRRRVTIPPSKPGQRPAERARELQVSLEGWWLSARSRPKGRALEVEVDDLRRELETVRFAPGRADHSDTVVELEDRLRGLMRQA